MEDSRKIEPTAPIGQRIKMLRDEKKLSQIELAHILDVGRTAVSAWEHNVARPMRRLDALADFFGVSTDYILCKTDKRNFTVTRSNKKGVKIPVLGSVPAGIPIEAIQDIEDWEEIPADLAAHGEYFALKVKGHSMEPTINDGDIAIVKAIDDVTSGSIALVYVDGYDATLKRVDKTEQGITLVGINSNVFPPRFYTWKQVKELPVTIGAVLVEIRRKFSF